jgi:hypothetical protein
MKTIEKVFNVEDNSETIIEKELTPKQIAELNAEKLEKELQMQQRLQARQEKIALLERLGITEEEAKLLLS